MQEQENPFDYQYNPNQLVEIPGNVLLNVMIFCEKVLKTQPVEGIPYVYPTNMEEVRDEVGNLMKVNIDWLDYKQGDLSAFFNSTDKPIPFATEVSIISQQVLHAFSMLHKDNIEKGLAKKVETLTKEEDDEQIAQLLSKPTKGKA